jgi:cytochrome c oxidase cbb3-type subunit III
MKRVAALVLMFGAIAINESCKREERVYRIQPPDAEVADSVPVTSFQAGPATQAVIMPSNPYENNAYALTEGQRLFNSMNCVGCHFHGGGGIGPPLMDATWIYGGQPAQIFDTIIRGRPNGMPSFRNRLQESQAWMIVAYVRSLSGNANPNAAPGRDDHMNGPPPPASIKKQPPTQSTQPPSTVMPS